MWCVCAGEVEGSGRRFGLESIRCKHSKHVQPGSDDPVRHNFWETASCGAGRLRLGPVCWSWIHCLAGSYVNITVLSSFRIRDCSIVQ